MLSKTVLRQAFRTNLSRDDHDTTLIATSTRALNQRLIEFLTAQDGVWAAFEPLDFEPDVREAFAATPHIRWAYPRIEPGNTLSFYEVSSRAQLAKNQFGIWEPEPATAKRVHMAELRGLLIPGLAFDLNCNRLGRGKGYYDRALGRELIKPKPLKIGIALERQVSTAPLPCDAHDIAMDLVVTEKRTLKGPVL